MVSTPMIRQGLQATITLCLVGLGWLWLTCQGKCQFPCFCSKCQKQNADLAASMSGNVKSLAQAVDEGDVPPAVTGKKNRQQMRYRGGCMLMFLLVISTALLALL
jgi:hypothetical protein